MRYLLLTAALAMNMQAMLAQSSYQVKNSVTLRNEDCDLTKMSVILPVPVSNIYQDVVGLKGILGYGSRFGCLEPIFERHKDGRTAVLRRIVYVKRGVLSHALSYVHRYGTIHHALSV